MILILNKHPLLLLNLRFCLLFICFIYFDLEDRDVVSGLVHLHELGIIHRDLKPQNVLIIKDRCLCAKLSDMGISKRLTGDMASLGQHATGKNLYLFIIFCRIACNYTFSCLLFLVFFHLRNLKWVCCHELISLLKMIAALELCIYMLLNIWFMVTGYGSSGWQAPEQLLLGRQTRAVDLFSIGCVLFFCITGGRHPFGNRLERDVNIIKNQLDLFLVEHIPEAKELFSHLLNPDAEMRWGRKGHHCGMDSMDMLAFFSPLPDKINLLPSTGL